MLEKDNNLTEENIMRARLIKGSVANKYSPNATNHF